MLLPIIGAVFLAVTSASLSPAQVEVPEPTADSDDLETGTVRHRRRWHDQLLPQWSAWRPAMRQTLDCDASKRRDGPVGFAAQMRQAWLAATAVILAFVLVFGLVGEDACFTALTYVAVAHTVVQHLLVLRHVTENTHVPLASYIKLPLPAAFIVGIMGSCAAWLFDAERDLDWFPWETEQSLPPNATIAAMGWVVMVAALLFIGLRAAYVDAMNRVFPEHEPKAVLPSLGALVMLLTWAAGMFVHDEDTATALLSVPHSLIALVILGDAYYSTLSKFTSQKTLRCSAVVACTFLAALCYGEHYAIDRLLVGPEGWSAFWLFVVPMVLHFTLDPTGALLAAAD